MKYHRTSYSNSLIRVSIFATLLTVVILKTICLAQADHIDVKKEGKGYKRDDNTGKYILL